MPKPSAVRLLAGLVVLLILAAVATSVLAWRSGRAAVTRDAVVAAARAEAAAFTSYDYRHLDRDFDRVAQGATGKFRTQYKAAMKQLDDTVTTQHGVSKGSVVAAGVQRLDGDRATVLAVIQATVSAKDQKPAVKHYRLRLSLQRVGGRWLTSNVVGVV